MAHRRIDFSHRPVHSREQRVPLRFHIEGDKIISSVTGREIPEDELLLLRVYNIVALVKSASTVRDIADELKALLVERDQLKSRVEELEAAARH